MTDEKRNQPIVKKGVIYLIANNDVYAEKLLISFYTLRKHFDGPVTIFCTRSVERAASMVARDHRLMADLSVLPIDIKGYFGACRLKAMLTSDLPYDKNVLLDLDTTIHGGFDELFPTDGELVLTPIFDFFSDNPKCKTMHNLWRQFCPELVKIQEAQRLPRVNAGVIGLPKVHPIYQAWRDLLTKNTRMETPCPEESALQLLWPHYRQRFVDSKYNYWANRADDGTAIIYHYYKNGQNSPQYRPIFRAIRDEILQADVAGVGSWKRLRGSLFPSKVVQRGG